jgi:hypothetical protein
MHCTSCQHAPGGFLKPAQELPVSASKACSSIARVGNTVLLKQHSVSQAAQCFLQSKHQCVSVIDICTCSPAR